MVIKQKIKRIKGTTYKNENEINDNNKRNKIASNNALIFDFSLKPQASS